MKQCFYVCVLGLILIIFSVQVVRCCASDVNIMVRHAIHNQKISSHSKRLFAKSSWLSVVSSSCDCSK